MEGQSQDVVAQEVEAEVPQVVEMQQYHVPVGTDAIVEDAQATVITMQAAEEISVAEQLVQIQEQVPMEHGMTQVIIEQVQEVISDQIVVTSA